MKKILIVLLFFCNFYKTFTQDLKTHESFIRENFSKFFKQFPNLDFDNFIIETSSEIEMNDFLQFEIEEWNLYLNCSDEFIVYNPSRTFAADFNSYGDVDQETKLLYVKNRSEKRIYFCGTSCRFNAAKWVNDDVLILVGTLIDYDYYDEASDSYRINIILMIVDLKNKTKNIFFNK